MITKGIITAIDFTGNTCTVRMPLFENVSNDQITGTAIISNTPGSYNGYKVNDVVLVGFEDGQMDKPIILGKLYLGVDREKADPRGVINVENSTTAKTAILPADTKLANQVDKNMANTAAPYGSLSSLANNLNTLNRDVDQLSVFTHNQFKNIVKEIDSSGSELITKIEQNTRKIELEAQRREDEDNVLSGRITVNANNISAKVEKTQAATSSTGFGWDLDNSHWVLNTYKDGEAVPIFKANSGGVEITNELKIVGYPSITYTRYCQVPIYKSDISNPDPEQLNDWNQKVIIEYDEDDPNTIIRFDPIPPVYRISETGEPVEDWLVTGWENCKPNQILIEGIDEIPGSYPRTTMPAFYDADADDPLNIGPYWVWQIDYAQTWQYQSWDWALVDETDGADSNNTFDTREKYNGDEQHTYYIKNTYVYEEITSSTSGIIPGTTKAWKKQALADGTVVKAIMNVEAYPIDYGDDPRIKDKIIRVSGGGRAGLIRVVDAEITKLARQARDMAYGATVLAQGKSTNYYDDDDPATTLNDPDDPTSGYKYIIKEGDCWFDTSISYTKAGVIDHADADGHFATRNEYNGYYLKSGNSYTGPITSATTGITVGTTIAYKQDQNVLRQWTGNPSNKSPIGHWVDIGGELVANKITANYINALDITAKKITVLQDNTQPESSTNEALFKADSTGTGYVKIADMVATPDNLTYYDSDGTTVLMQLGEQDRDNWGEQAYMETLRAQRIAIEDLASQNDDQYEDDPQLLVQAELGPSTTSGIDFGHWAGGAAARVCFASWGQVGLVCQRHSFKKTSSGWSYNIWSTDSSESQAWTSSYIQESDGARFIKPQVPFIISRTGNYNGTKCTGRHYFDRGVMFAYIVDTTNLSDYYPGGSKAGQSLIHDATYNICITGDNKNVQITRTYGDWSEGDSFCVYLYGYTQYTNQLGSGYLD